MANTNYSEQVKSLGIIHLALLGGQVMFLGVAFYLRYSGSFPADGSLRTVYMVMAMLFVFGGIAIGNMIFKSRLKLAQQAVHLRDKLMVYRQGSITRFALVEGPSFFAIITFMLTGDYAFTAWAIVAIAYFFTLRPTPARIEDDLMLSVEEKAQLQ